MIKKIILISALCASTAHAEFFTGNDLLTRMHSADLYDNMIAMGYVMGIFDSHRGVGHCPPENVTSGQVRDMVKLHLESSPSMRQHTADLHVKFVFSRAWPCAKKGAGV